MAQKQAIKENNGTNQVHFILQGKGGVGKSLIAAIVAQYFHGIGAPVNAIDTDPVNQTFTNYKKLNAQHIKIMEGSKIDERNFDMLMERLLSEDGIFVVDNGASSFVPLSNYLIENNALEMLVDSGRQVFIHCVVTGGQALLDTLSGFVALAEQTPNKNIVVWLNEYFGSIEMEGKSFTEMKAFQKHENKVYGIARIAKRNSDTFGKDIELMVSNKMTFSEAIESPNFSLMAKQRIRTVQKDINNQLEEIGF
jgi:dephospho-CoA kinase